MRHTFLPFHTPFVTKIFAFSHPKNLYMGNSKTVSPICAADKKEVNIIRVFGKVETPQYLEKGAVSYVGQTQVHLVVKRSFELVVQLVEPDVSLFPLVEALVSQVLGAFDLSLDMIGTKNRIIFGAGLYRRKNISVPFLRHFHSGNPRVPPEYPMSSFPRPQSVKDKHVNLSVCKKNPFQFFPREKNFLRLLLGSRD